MKDINKLTKKELLERLWKAENQLQRLENEGKAKLANRYMVDYQGKRRVVCIALPLTNEEKTAVQQYAEYQVSSLAGEGRIINQINFTDNPENETTVFDLPLEWSHWRSNCTELPNYAGLLVRYEYNRQSGTFVQEIWGLAQVKGESSYDQS